MEAITELLEKYPNGIAEKYAKRLRQEVDRSYAKFAKARARLHRAALAAKAYRRRICLHYRGAGEQHRSG